MRDLILLLAAIVLGLVLAGDAEAARWTYPGDIASHLANGHGVIATGMSREQAEALHDRLHDQGQTRNLVRPNTWQYRSRPVMANGIRGVLRGGVFGRRR